jgi:hypothetical protein
MTIPLKYTRSDQKVTLAGWLRLLGLFLGVCALVAIVKAAIDTYKESEHAKWPSTNRRPPGCAGEAVEV